MAGPLLVANKPPLMHNKPLHAPKKAPAHSSGCHMETGAHEVNAKCVLNMVRLDTAPTKRQCSMSSVSSRSGEPMPSQSRNSTSVSAPSAPRTKRADSHTPSVQRPPATSKNTPPRWFRWYDLPTDCCPNAHTTCSARGEWQRLPLVDTRKTFAQCRLRRWCPAEARVP
jgi:hypothetical protein